MSHITIKRRGQEPRPQRCHADASLFTCPFCSADVCKPRQYHQIMTHIAGHKLRAVEYGDHVIYSCNICCGKMARHFHCCQCPKTYINKSVLKKHLCSSHPIDTSTLKTQPVSDPQQDLPSQQPTSHPQQDLPSRQPTSHPQQDPPSQQLTSNPQQEPPSQKPTSHPQQDPPSQQPTSNPQDPPSQKPTSHPQQDPHSQQPTSNPQQDPSSQQPTSYPQQDPPSQKPTSHPQQDPHSQQPTSNPQQDPSSQQPTSYPQQDPPSQQPESHPQQDPPSQQPTSQPLPSAAPPAIKRGQISVQCCRRHITIKRRGQEPRPQRCHADASLFTCPFCSADVCKPRQYHQIMTHIAGHKLRAVEYGDHVIYSCNIGCGKMARHFHCCQCPKTYINKGALKKHLCSSHPIATSTLKTQPVSDPLQEPPSQQPTSQPQQDPPPQQPTSQPQENPPLQQKKQSWIIQHITVKRRGQEPRPQRCDADASLFTCPFCSADVCKPRQYHQIMTHIAGHKLRAVEYGDHVIYSCDICCGKMARHFHCCQCPKTYINKSVLKKHLCSSHPIDTSTLKTQPVSDPQQDLPSKKPTSHPQQDPPSQQPTSQTLPSAAPPAIKRTQISVQCRRRHITVKRRGEEPRPQRCHADASLFTCPFCSADVCKPRKYKQIMAHITGHKLRAVEYGDDVIYSCNSCCEKARHFHCCQCPQTYFNQSALRRHLYSTHPKATGAPEPQPIDRPLQEPPLQQPAPRPVESMIVKRKQISVQCPHCGVSLNSKNVKTHIKRKHHEAITATWDSSHKVICEIDNGKSCVEMAPSSELLLTQCVSLSTVDYTCAAAASEGLSEDVWAEME